MEVGVVEETRRYALHHDYWSSGLMMQFFLWLEVVALPVVRHSLPGPTRGDLLRDLLRIFSDGTRGTSLDV